MVVPNKIPKISSRTTSKRAQTWQEGTSPQLTIIKEEIRARHLLQHLNRNAQQSPIPHSRARKDLPNRVLAALAFHLQLILHFLELLLDDAVVLADAVQLGDALGGALDLTEAEIVAWRLWEK
jgi:hypothetical protein